MNEPLRELSLFTGAGGGILGTHLLGWRPIGYVEWDDYCQRVLAARIADGLIPSAPIFGDVREFVQSGAAEQYRGFADVVSAGFPCQPHSVAGKQLGADDPRDMWPATRDCIRLVRPRSVLLENVPGILAGYAARVIADLAAMGYVGQTGCISAADTGAPHLRKRWWVVAHANNNGQRQLLQPQRQSERGETPNARRNGKVQHVAHAKCNRGEGSANGGCIEDKAENDSRCSPLRRSSKEWREWPIEPDVGRVANGVASRVDRLKAIGNGQVPRVVRTAWELLA